MIKNTAFLALLAALLTGCGPNKIIVDLPSPQGQYHVEVRKCPQPGSMSSAEQTQVSILKSGISENCQSAVNALAQFQSYSPDEQLQLEWLSEAELRAWHPGFDPKSGPASASYKADNPVKVIFAPAK
ncbi:hypothetical protein ACFZAI_13945 [Achromobacter sp. NPDC008082]|jgi:hypothetical protein